MSSLDDAFIFDEGDDELARLAERALDRNLVRVNVTVTVTTEILID